MIQAIVTDIEGTTSSLTFVKEVLFPYARKHIPDFIRTNCHNLEIKSILDAARLEAGLNLTDEQLIDVFINWLDQDQKITPLKALQGLIWKAGYENADFTGHIYEDAARCLKQFNKQGYALYVYSSGSVQAQKLLFANSEFGDLTKVFSGYFDTLIGGKKEVHSYFKIANKINIPAEQILFLSDIKEELDAARTAGFETYWLVRDKTPNLTAEHRQISDFDQISF